MRTVSLATYLEADQATIWAHVQTPRLLHYVTSGLIRFMPKGKA